MVMSRIISIVNQKGGVGKTTTSVNLAAYLAYLGKFVLLVDLDPQGNATSGLGIDSSELDGVYQAIGGEKKFKDIAIQTSHQGLKVAPATPELAAARVELVDAENREFLLHQAILEVRNDYDFIIIDCPPSLDLLTLNGLVAADELLVPVQAEYLALEGLGQLLSTINLVTENLKPSLKVLGAVVTMFDKRNKLSRQVAEDIQQNFPHHVFTTIIPRNVRLTEAPSYGQSILAYDAGSKGGKSYLALAQEIIQREFSQE